MDDTPLDPVDQQRLAKLSAAAHRDDVAIIEIIANGKYVKFDLAMLQLTHWTPAQLVERGLREAFKAVGIDLPAEMPPPIVTPNWASSSITTT
jgi:hypothetical protein